MLFQVLKDGKVMFHTEYPEAVPGPEEIAALKKSGYKIKEIADTKKSKKEKKENKK